MEEREYTDIGVGRVVIRRSRAAKRLSVRVHPLEGIRLTIPYRVSYEEGLAFLASRRDWILKAVMKQGAAVREAMDDMKQASGAAVDDIPSEDVRSAAVEKWRKEAKAVLPPRLRELAAKYGFAINRVFVKHNVSNWGSCSSHGNINLNLNLVRLPQSLRDYVMLHELCHLRYMNHGPQFHALLASLCRKEFGTEGSSTVREMRSALKRYLLL